MDTSPSLWNEITDAFTSQPIKIIVGQGDTQKSYYIHKGHLERRAPTLIILLSGDPAEKEKATLDLPNVTYESFEVFSEWLYYDKLTSLSDVRLTASALRWKILKTVVFADKYSLIELHDRALSILVHNHHGIIPLDDLKPITSFVLGNSMPQCTMRAFLARMWAWYIQNYIDCGIYLGDVDDFEHATNHPRFSIEVFSYGDQEANQEENPFTEDEPCDFHIHQDLDKCPFKKLDGLNGSSQTVPENPGEVVGVKRLASKPLKTLEDIRYMRSLASSPAKKRKRNQED